MFSLKKLVSSVLLLLLCYILTGCFGSPVVEIAEPSPIPITPITAMGNVLDSAEPSNSPAPSQQTEETSSIDQKISKMTLEEKVGQLFICAFRKDSAGRSITEILGDSASLIRDYGISGVILFSENIVSANQAKEYIEALKSCAKIPIFVGIDEEGGRVVRTKSLNLPQIPAPGVIGQNGNTEDAYGYAKTIANYLTALGFNINFAPSADIYSNPNNSVIGDRSFGSDPKLVGEMAGAYVYGFQENGLMAVLKHFPGHGQTSEDSHFGAAITEARIPDLKEAGTLLPFEMGIKAHATGVMLGHISAPNITFSKEPVSFSKYFVTDLLRNEMGFDGIVFTDALDMEAITKYYSPGEAAVKAIQAGVDVLLMPEDFHKAYDAVLGAVEDGEITEDRINESVRRILEAKADFLSK